MRLSLQGRAEQMRESSIPRPRGWPSTHHPHNIVPTRHHRKQAVNRETPRTETSFTHHSDTNTHQAVDKQFQPKDPSLTPLTRHQHTERMNQQKSKDRNIRLSSPARRNGHCNSQVSAGRPARARSPLKTSLEVALAEAEGAVGARSARRTQSCIGLRGLHDYLQEVAVLVAVNKDTAGFCSFLNQHAQACPMPAPRLRVLVVRILSVPELHTFARRTSTLARISQFAGRGESARRRGRL